MSPSNLSDAIFHSIKDINYPEITRFLYSFSFFFAQAARRRIVVTCESHDPTLEARVLSAHRWIVIRQEENS